MSIDSITFSITQHGAQRRVMYKAVDHLGQTHKYGPVLTVDKAYDPKAHTAEVAAKIERVLARDESEQWLEETEKVAPIKHGAPVKFLSEWRRKYKEAVKLEHLRLGYKMHREILARTFTPPQMNSAWNMDRSQRLAFLGRVKDAHDAWVVIQGKAGE